MSGLSSRNGHIELIVSRSGHPDRRLLLKPGVLRLGRAEDNDLVLPDVGVSRRHARIIVDNAGVTIEDLGSGNGTLLKGRPVRQKRVEDNESFSIDPFTLRFRIHADGVRASAPYTSGGGARIVLMTEEGVPASVYPIPATGLTLGRSTEQRVVLNDPGASREHAILFPRQGGCWLQDNRSINGTFVNDERIYQHMVKHNDIIRIGATQFRLDMGDPSQSGDPLSQLWEESGVYPRPIRDDSEPLQPLPGFIAPVARPELPPLDEPTAQLGARGQGRMLALVGVLLALLVVFTIGSITLVSQLKGQDWASLTSSPVEAPPPDTTIPVVLSNAEAGKLYVIGRALLAAGRPLEAATPLYQARGLEPAVGELGRLGYAACEASAMQVLANTMRHERLSAEITSRTVRGLSRSADRTDDDGLLVLRGELVDALRVFPDSSQLIRAIGTVDSRLAGIAIAKVQQAEEEVAREDSWALLEEALVLSPTTGVAAKEAWNHIALARDGALPKLEQALLMEISANPSAAATLYTEVVEMLPGQDDPMERLARARVDSLGR